MSLATRVGVAMSDLVEPTIPDKIGVAVSGGGDSLTLLNCLATWAQKRATTLYVATVDHGLREGAAQEIALVARACKSLGFSHDVLVWSGPKGHGNLQGAARSARYRLLADWARDRDIGHVAFGHTLDDQAETVLMRLARGSGVDGLSAMARRREFGGICWLRPMLGIGRDEAREFLRSQKISWADDPSNDDHGFDRIKMRTALEVLENLGISRAVLADTAGRLATARQALQHATQDAARAVASVRAGGVTLISDPLSRQPGEIQRRLLVHALCWVSGEAYAPRASAIADLQDKIQTQSNATLHGCQILVGAENIVIFREYSAVSETQAEPGQLWDRRWRLSGPEGAMTHVAALGDVGLSDCKNWRDTGLPRQQLISGPAVWKNDDLIAAPLAAWPNSWHAELVQGENHFFSSIITH